MELLFQIRAGFILGKTAGKYNHQLSYMEINITKEGTGGYNDFAWIDGTSQTDGSGGQWNFKESAQSDYCPVSDRLDQKR